jgi:hypothetical protein
MLAVFGAKTRFAQSGGVGVCAKKALTERDDLRLLQSAQHATIFSMSTALATELSLAIANR